MNEPRVCDVFEAVAKAAANDHGAVPVHKRLRMTCEVTVQDDGTYRIHDQCLVVIGDSEPTR